jgi:mono/diheme cytochrome c family protein
MIARRVLGAALSLASCAAIVPVALAESPIDAANAEIGREKFQLFCASCHGPGGQGDGVAAKGLNPPPRNFVKGDFKYGGTDQDIFEVISNGAASKGGSPLMVAWAPVIPEADRWALVKYIRSLKQ